jgi:hypothetical protein
MELGAVKVELASRTWRRGWDYPNLGFGSDSRALLLTLARDAPRQSNGVRISRRSLPMCAEYDTVVANRREVAEGVGFEPTRPFGLPVFKTGAINHSTTPPEQVHDVWTSKPILQCSVTPRNILRVDGEME